MKGLTDMILALPQDIIVVEIGSYAGESAELFLKSGKVSKICCIDPWKSFVDRSDNAIHINMSKIRKTFEDKFKHDVRVLQFVGTVDDFISSDVKLPRVDVVYIDGNHEYSYVKNDILKTMNCLKPKVAISGHDYDMCEVKQAISDTIGMPDNVYVDSSWRKFM